MSSCCFNSANSTRRVWGNQEGEWMKYDGKITQLFSLISIASGVALPPKFQFGKPRHHQKKKQRGHFRGAIENCQWRIERLERIP
jgi:hypothetical protein